jgi:hypothetical protein
VTLAEVEDRVRALLVPELETFNNGRDNLRRVVGRKLAPDAQRQVVDLIADLERARLCEGKR